MILVDSSVIIDYIDKANPVIIRTLRQVQPAIAGIIRAEVLAGASTSAKWDRISVALDDFDYLAFPETLWDQVARHSLQLRFSGYKFPFNDVAIATLALHYDCELWTRDKQFALIQSVLPSLKLFQEPAS